MHGVHAQTTAAPTRGLARLDATIILLIILLSLVSLAVWYSPGFPGVEDARAPIDHQLALLKRNLVFGEHEAHALMVDQRLAEGFARAGIGGGDLLRADAAAQPTLAPLPHPTRSRRGGGAGAGSRRAA